MPSISSHRTQGSPTPHPQPARREDLNVHTQEGMHSSHQEKPGWGSGLCKARLPLTCPVLPSGPDGPAEYLWPLLSLMSASCLSLETSCSRFLSTRDRLGVPYPVKSRWASLDPRTDLCLSLLPHWFLLPKLQPSPTAFLQN